MGKLKANIKPIVKVIYADGKKGKVEIYERPAVITVTRVDGTKAECHRSGPDEYREYVPKLARKPLKEERLILNPDGSRR